MTMASKWGISLILQGGRDIVLAPWIAWGIPVAKYRVRQDGNPVHLNQHQHTCTLARP